MMINGVEFKTVRYTQFSNIFSAIQLLEEFDGFFDADSQCVCYKDKEG